MSKREALEALKKHLIECHNGERFKRASLDFSEVEDDGLTHWYIDVPCVKGPTYQFDVYYSDEVWNIDFIEAI